MEIVSSVLENRVESVLVETDSESGDVESTFPVKHGEAMEMFDKCLSWVQQQPEASSYSTSMLLSLRELAAKKR